MKNTGRPEMGTVSLTATAEEAELDAETKAQEPFCPHKDLNLPKSYDEVVLRMKRLQGTREAEDLN
ncbi:MAG: hypothetical protein R2810_15945 [Flavobacteriales bacterium]|nr:hypothetical protein [Flavobacteriales bacterium]MCB0818752.1 hypothetical protein [Flavobacteriales bacterium]MCB9181518.1 hypothetical protein [Flavobacteriales bacterium]MCB9200138.1 hypothetical protein [Flavobacteriales bacterium]HOP43379.1 hypothetical protein [Flavobacteriales bacterium]